MSEDGTERSPNYAEKVSTLYQLRKDLDGIREKQQDYLNSYYTDINTKIGFSRPRIYLDENDNETDKLYPGLLSTCFAITSLAKQGFKVNDLDRMIQNIIDNDWSYFVELPSYSFHDSKKWIEVDSIMMKKETAPSKESEDTIQYTSKDSNQLYAILKPTEYDIYTSPIILNSLFYAKKKEGADWHKFFDNSDRVKQSLREIIKNLVQNKGAARFNSKYQESGFLTYCAMNILIKWIDFCTNNSIVWTNDGKTYSASDAIIQGYDWLKSELYKQISFYKSDNFEFIDPIRCIFALAGYRMCLKKRNRISKFKEKILDKKIFNTAIECIFSDQQRNGLWKKYYPILALPNDGNVYPFALYSFDRLVDLSHPTANIFTEYAENVRAAINWIKENEIDEYIIKNSTGAEIQTIQGWRSNHAISKEGPPEAWSTSLVFDAVNCMRKKLNVDLNEEIIIHYGGIPFDKNSKEECELPINLDYGLDDIDNLYHSVGSNSVVSFGKFVKKEIIVPITEFEKLTIDEKNSLGNDELPPNAVILYGPPGTGKTKLTEVIANELRWSYLRIDTGMLLRDGLDKSALAIEEIFNDLSKLEKTVILFDEIDECIRKRGSSTNQDVQNRVLTNIMLTKLNDLKKNNEIIYFVNTNYYEMIDNAIKREGRFDKKLHIGLSKKNNPKISIFGILAKIMNEKTDKIKEEIDESSVKELFEKIKETDIDKAYLIFHNPIDKNLEDKKIEKFKEHWKKMLTENNPYLCYLDAYEWQKLLESILKWYSNFNDKEIDPMNWAYLQEKIKYMNNKETEADFWTPSKIEEIRNQIQN